MGEREDKMKIVFVESQYVLPSLVDGRWEPAKAYPYFPGPPVEIPQELWEAYLQAINLVVKVDDLIEDYLDATQLPA